MTTKKSASTGQNRAAKSSPTSVTTPAQNSTPTVVEGVELRRLPMEANEPAHPVAMFKGTAPTKDEVLEFTLENGVTYRGVVADAIEAAGEVMAEFKGPLKVVSTK